MQRVTLRTNLYEREWGHSASLFTRSNGDSHSSAHTRIAVGGSTKEQDSRQRGATWMERVAYVVPWFERLHEEKRCLLRSVGEDRCLFLLDRDRYPHVQPRHGGVEECLVSLNPRIEPRRPPWAFTERGVVRILAGRRVVDDGGWHHW